jgi:hypothetical protein
MSFVNFSDKEYKAELKKMDAIFYGEVISISPIDGPFQPSRGPKQDIKVKVLTVWKGVDAPEVTINYNGAYYSFDEEIGGVGTRKIFLAGKAKKSAKLLTGLCLFTSYDSERTRRVLGEGKDVEVLPSPASPASQGFASALWKNFVSLFS